MGKNLSSYAYQQGADQWKRPVWPERPLQEYRGLIHDIQTITKQIKTEQRHLEGTTPRSTEQKKAFPPRLLEIFEFPSPLTCKSTFGHECMAALEVEACAKEMEPHVL